MKILIADDSKTMRMIIRHMLCQFERRKFSFLEACDGQEALMKAQFKLPDLILSDWQMPKKSGIDFLKELRASGLVIPFGLITAGYNRELRAQATELGANFFLTKPFSLIEFQSYVERYIV